MILFKKGYSFFIQIREMFDNNLSAGLQDMIIARDHHIILVSCKEVE